MFEFHGWAVLRWPGAVAGTDAQVSAIRQAVDSARSNFSMAELVTPGNELTIVCVHGCRNHRMPGIEHLFAVIAEQAPESYGLLYLRDDEDVRGLDFENCFRAWRLARGEFAEAADPFLSPCIPTIELPYDSGQAQ